MDQYRCSVCGWIYEEENGYPEGGIAAGTPFESLDKAWFCPFCSAPKEKFDKMEQP